MTPPVTLIDILARTPDVIGHLLAEIPPDRHEARRVEGQWCVTEWICHLLDAQEVLVGRFRQFETEENPLIADYELPPQSDSRYLERSLADALARFAAHRAASVARLRGYDEEFWNRRGRHESFSPYGTRILLGHMLNVDYAHLFAIENAGLAAL